MYCLFFFFKVPAAPEIYPLALHDALRSDPKFCAPSGIPAASSDASIKIRFITVSFYAASGKNKAGAFPMWNPLRPVFKAEFRLFSLRALLGLLLTHQLLVALLEFRFLDRFTFS